LSPATCGFEVGGALSAGGSVLAWDEARKHARWWLIRPRHGCREMPWLCVLENFVINDANREFLGGAHNNFSPMFTKRADFVPFAD